jgi:hypothetical protein
MGAGTTYIIGNFLYCWPLTLAVAAGSPGTGGVGTNPSYSPGCSNSKFVTGAAVSVIASPGVGWALLAWTGPLASYLTSTIAYTMPSNSVTATVLFGYPCSVDITSTSVISVNTARNITYRLWGAGGGGGAAPGTGTQVAATDGAFVSGILSVKNGNQITGYAGGGGGGKLLRLKLSAPNCNT